MADRDFFAAAALRGLLCNGDYSMESIPRHAFSMADAMLRERGNHPETPDSSANHDAVPEAKAMQSRDCSGVLSGTGNTPEPVAWAVVSDSREEIDCEFVYPDRATAGDVALDINGGVFPLYRSPTLTKEERDAIKTAIGIVDWQAAYFSHLKQNEPLPSATLRKLLERLR